VRAIYTASKHAAKQGMRVNAVAFGTIQTPMIDRMVVWYFCLCGLSTA